ncbi:MAG: hypothetical protein JXL97_03815 [Bacteroidales bacterium]|nr:hypothetical protein [Bacteroidales bacterium]
MKFLQKLFGRNQIGNTESEKSKNYSFIELCLENKYQELNDNRWFSHFKELPEIDNLKKNGQSQAALKLCLKSLETYSDSFLFYGRAADLYDAINQPKEAIKILKVGLSKSLSKCSLAKHVAERAFKRNDYREAILWWIQSCVMQMESKIMVEYLPFLNLAYICQPLGLKNEEKWFLSKADNISNQGPIRFDSTGTKLRHDLIMNAKNNDRNEVVEVLQEFIKRYGS